MLRVVVVVVVFRGLPGLSPGREEEEDKINAGRPGRRTQRRSNTRARNVIIIVITTTVVVVSSTSRFFFFPTHTFDLPLEHGT